MSIYDIDVEDIKGNDVSLADYKGKILLIVNTATGCAFTQQYTALQELYQKYQKYGFEILDFACNQFGAQAPGSNEEIGAFCTGHFGTTFDRFAKIDVNGEYESPLYTWLKQEKGGLGSSKIKWNFTKFLIDKDGKLIKRFAPTTTPAAIEKYLVKLFNELK